MKNLIYILIACVVSCVLIQDADATTRRSNRLPQRQRQRDNGPRFRLQFDNGRRFDRDFRDFRDDRRDFRVDADFFLPGEFPIRTFTQSDGDVFSDTNFGRRVFRGNVFRQGFRSRR